MKLHSIWFSWSYWYLVPLNLTSFYSSLEPTQYLVPLNLQYLVLLNLPSSLKPIQYLVGPWIYPVFSSVEPTWDLPSSRFPPLSWTQTPQSCRNTLTWFHAFRWTWELVFTTPGPVPQSNLKISHETTCTLPTDHFSNDQFYKWQFLKNMKIYTICKIYRRTISKVEFPKYVIFKEAISFL